MELAASPLVCDLHSKFTEEIQQKTPQNVFVPSLGREIGASLLNAIQESKTGDNTIFDCGIGLKPQQYSSGTDFVTPTDFITRSDCVTYTGLKPQPHTNSMMEFTVLKDVICRRIEEALKTPCQPSQEGTISQTTEHPSLPILPDIRMNDKSSRSSSPLISGNEIVLRRKQNFRSLLFCRYGRNQSFQSLFTEEQPTPLGSFSFCDGLLAAKHLGNLPLLDLDDGESPRLSESSQHGFAIPLLKPRLSNANDMHFLSQW